MHQHTNIHGIVTPVFVPLVIRYSIVSLHIRKYKWIIIESMECKEFDRSFEWMEKERKQQCCCRTDFTLVMSSASNAIVNDTPFNRAHNSTFAIIVSNAIRSACLCRHTMLIQMEHFNDILWAMLSMRPKELFIYDNNHHPMLFMGDDHHMTKVTTQSFKLLFEIFMFVVVQYN